MIGKKYGMDYVTMPAPPPRRIALDWYPRFKDALKPVFEDLYESVKNGTETQRSLDFNSAPDYRARLKRSWRPSETWRSEGWRGEKACVPENQ